MIELPGCGRNGKIFQIISYDRLLYFFSFTQNRYATWFVKTAINRFLVSTLFYNQNSFFLLSLLLRVCQPWNDYSYNIYWRRSILSMNQKGFFFRQTAESVMSFKCAEFTKILNIKKMANFWSHSFKILSRNFKRKSMWFIKRTPNKWVFIF